MFDMPDSKEKELKVTKNYVEKALVKSTIKKLKAVS
jgi:ATP-dependent Clp protease ATP-binding subunit ClpX